MEEIAQPGGLWAGIGMAIVSVIGGAIWLFTKLSSVSVDRAGDRAEVHIIEVLQNDNAKLRELFTVAESEKREYFQKFMEANTQVSLLTEKVTQLTEQVSELKGKIEHLSRTLEGGV